MQTNTILWETRLLSSFQKTALALQAVLQWSLPQEATSHPSASLHHLVCQDDCVAVTESNRFTSCQR